jgi:hypothetical protein
MVTYVPPGFKNKKFYILRTERISVMIMVVTTNSDFLPAPHQLSGFNNQHGEC